MSANDIRKNIFINSQYCTYYIDNKQTVVAGLMRNIGYKYQNLLSEGQISLVEKTHRKYNTILNSIIGIGIILYLYCLIFPLYTEIFNLQNLLGLMIAIALPLIILYVVYSILNKNYEKFLINNLGNCEKIKFKPNIYNIDPKAYEKYITTPRKSVYILLFILFAFLFYIFTPSFLEVQNNNKNYKLALITAKIYSAIIPINPIVYAQKGYAEYKLSKFKDATIDYQKANKYSFSNTYDAEILASQMEYLPKDKILNGFDEIIKREQREDTKRFLSYEKALYLQKNNDNSEALKIYNELIKAYESGINTGFKAENIYYNRGLIKEKLGDIAGAKTDKNLGKRFCPECDFKLKSDIIQ